MDELSWADGLVSVESKVDRAIVEALRGRDLSGFEIWRWLTSDGSTFALITEPALYPTLHRLEAARILQADWHEGERARRTYHLTAKALELADDKRWPALPRRGSPNPVDEAAHRDVAFAARLASPDPEAGSWFVPPKKEPTGAEALAHALAELSRSGSGKDRPAVGPVPAEASPTGDPAHAAIARYVGDFESALDLPRVEAGQVSQEIADHLTDSVALLVHGGLDAATAASEAIDRLGDPRDLAAHISQAEHTKVRRDRALRRGLFELVGEIVLWLAAAAIPLSISTGLAATVGAFAHLAELHLVVITSATWATNQLAMMLCIGAFAAGRLSFGHLARISRHSDAAIRKPWAIGGASAVLVVALLLPGWQDWLVVATLLAAPFAFVAGTYRPKHQNESAYTWRGIATAIVLVVVVMFVPAYRLFAYDPNGTPGTAPAAGRAPGKLVVYQNANGTFSYEVAGTSDNATIDVWPASQDGFYMVADRSATSPTRSGVTYVDMAELPPGGQWWIAAVVVGPDGQRTVLAVVIQAGGAPAPGTALGWLISRL